MQKFVMSTAIVGSMLMLAGCDTTSAIAGYSPSTTNVIAFQTALKPKGAVVQVGDFGAAPDVANPTCRMAGALDVSQGKRPEHYVRDALQTELFTAQVYDVNAPVAITGSLDQLEVNTFGTGSWTLGLTVRSSADPVGYRVTTVRQFKSSYSAYSACQNATNAFAPTVQQLIGQVVSNPGFSKLAGMN